MIVILFGTAWFFLPSQLYLLRFQIYQKSGGQAVQLGETIRPKKMFPVNDNFIQ
jgi:hypothetical protein